MSARLWRTIAMDMLIAKIQLAVFCANVKLVIPVMAQFVLVSIIIFFKNLTIKL